MIYVLPMGIMKTANIYIAQPVDDNDQSVHGVQAGEVGR